MELSLDVVGLVVADMGRSLAFYRRLGVDLPADGDSQPHVDVTLPSGLRLAFDTIDTIRSFDPGWTPPSGGHRVALAFACESPHEVDACYAELMAAGHDGHLEPWDAFWGQRYAVVHDPDGNAVDLFAPLSVQRVRSPERDAGQLLDVASQMGLVGVARPQRHLDERHAGAGQGERSGHSQHPGQRLRAIAEGVERTAP